MYDPEELTPKPAMVTSHTDEDSWLALRKGNWMDSHFEFPFAPVLPVHQDNKTHFPMSLHEFPFCQISP